MAHQLGHLEGYLSSLGAFLVGPLWKQLRPIICVSKKVVYLHKLRNEQSHYFLFHLIEADKIIFNLMCDSTISVKKLWF